jgi:hypothetical protein
MICSFITGIWFIGSFVCGLLMRFVPSRISRNCQVDGIALLSDKPVSRALFSEQWLEKYTTTKMPDQHVFALEM